MSAYANVIWLASTGGLVFWYCLYCLLKKYLVRKIFDPVFRKSKPLESQESHNPAVPTDGHVRTTRDCSSTESKSVSVGVEVRPALPEKKVSEIAEKCLALVFSTLVSIFSVVIMWETRDDAVHSRSKILFPLVNFIFMYFIIDLLAMWNSFWLSSTVTVTSSKLSKKLQLFLQKKWPYVAHHVVLVGVGWPCNCLDVRGGLGDFAVGAFMAHEFSSPLLAIAKILKMLGLHNTTLALLNGSLLIIIFFVCRVAKWPLVIFLIAAQHHNYNMLETARAMTPICYVTMSMDLSLEIYWLRALTAVALQTVKKLH